MGGSSSRSCFRYLALDQIIAQLDRRATFTTSVDVWSPFYAEQQLLFEVQGLQGTEGERDAALTVNNDLDHPQVNFSPGHDTSLTVVHAFICLLDATDLHVAIRQDPETH